MQVIWIDEARARIALQAQFATYRACAVQAGAKPSSLPDLTDPADEFTTPGPETSRAADPDARAAQIRAFIAASEGEGG